MDCNVMIVRSYLLLLKEVGSNAHQVVIVMKLVMTLALKVIKVDFDH